MAKRRYKILDQGRPVVIAKLINEALDVAIRETGKKQWQIAEEIAVSKNTLTNWRKGRTVPNDYDFEMLLYFLGQLNPPITEEFFNGAFKDDPYAEDPSFVAMMGDELKQYANEIGLNLHFLSFIKDYLNEEDYGLEGVYYQPWAPIRMIENEVPDDPEELYVHMRPLPAESNVAEKAGSFRIANRVLSKFDLDIFKETQDFIVKVVEHCFIERNREMLKEILTANDRRREKYLKAKEKAGGSELNDSDMVLTVGELGEIDKYYKEYMKEVPDDTLITDLPDDVINIH